MRIKLPKKKPKQDPNQWHNKFIWWPTVIEGEIVWLEQLIRRGFYRGRDNGKDQYNWEYVKDEFELLKKNQLNDLAEQASRPMQPKGMVMGKVVPTLNDKLLEHVKNNTINFNRKVK